MHSYFYGWYFKCQSDTRTLAVIPAFHQSRSYKSCSIQIITDQQAWNADFSASAFRHTRKNIFIDSNRFGNRGIRLNIHKPGLDVKGTLHFGPLTPLKYDIMGPFSLIPFLECRHSVWSMRHSVCGTVRVNGRDYSFQNGAGYWEGDRGRSFPREYAWTQCCFSGGSLMLSVADIPLTGLHFTGIICLVLWKGREYRLATYLGARAVRIRNGVIRVVQRDLELEAVLLNPSGKPLKAPSDGNMVRTIHESASCRAFYRFRKKGRTLFEFKTDHASFEYEYSDITGAKKNVSL